MKYSPKNNSSTPSVKGFGKRISKLAAQATVLTLSALMLSASPSAASTSVPSSFSVNGSGWGHGVGMSQYGAYGMAQEGYTATQILQHYYNPAKVVSSTSYASSDIAVQLVRAGTSSVTPANGSMRIIANGGTYTTTSTVTFKVSGSNVVFTVNGKTITAPKASVQWEGTRYWPVSGKTTTVSVPGADGGNGTGVYRHGQIQMSVLNGAVNVINNVRLNDEYLYGLAEVPASWPAAALQTQAIAGRTYAMRNMGSLKSACACNVYDEVASQKFTGWKNENSYYGANWKQAVNNTLTRSGANPASASVITYNGALIDAVYSSSTGGKTRAGADVWGTQTPYLQSRDDRWAMKPSTGNPNISWSYSVTQAKTASNFGLPNVASVSITKDPDGTIGSATARSSTGATSTLTGSQFLSKFPWKAEWINSVTGSGSTPAPGGSTSSPTIKTAGDIIAVDSNGVLWNYGNPVATRTKIGTGWHIMSDIHVIDWNQDGIQDILAKHKDGRLFIYKGYAQGGFEKSHIGNGWGGYEITVDKWKKTDKYPSIIARHTTGGGLYVYPNNSGHGLSSRTQVGTGWHIFQDIMFFDWDKDGNNDVIAKTKDGLLISYRTNGAGQFLYEKRPVLGKGWNVMSSQLAIAGYNGKGVGVVAKSTDGKLWFYETGASSWKPRVHIGNGWGTYLVAQH